MEVVNDALKYVVQAKNLSSKLLDEQTLNEIRELLNKAEEALVKQK